MIYDASIDDIQRQAVDDIHAFGVISSKPLTIFARTVDQNGFSIVKDTVSRISRDEIPKSYSEGRRTVNVIYFAKYGRCVAPKVRTSFDLSGVGNEFYLVISHKKDEIIFAYNSAMSECKELDNFI